MSDDRRHRGEGVVDLGAWDADLSALLDGELDAAAERAVRERIAADPELAERFAQLGEADALLRRAAADLPDEARLARIREGLHARIEAEGAPVAETDEATPWAWGPHFQVALAVAACLVLYFLYGAEGLDPQRAEAPRVAVEEPTPEVPVVVAEVEPAPTRREATEAEVAVPETAKAPALAASVRERETVTEAAGMRTEAPRLAESATEPPPADAMIDAASEEEIAVALQYDVLADLDVIENLELLVMLDELDRTEPL